MALFPIYGRFVGDCVALLVAVDTDDTMEVVAEKVAVHCVGPRLPVPAEPPGYDVYLDGRLVPPTTRLAELGIAPLQWLDVAYRE
jgi:Toluene-4-monooxygenase system protein B (TmoB)